MIAWNLIARLVTAGLLGAIVGLERELRAKEAGVRTHFVVALGSALFMIISQYAFQGTAFDASRVAAQVVSGIGFIGAGVIIFQKNVVRGVTTAAGLWVVAAIGLAAGARMFDIALTATLLTVVCLETMHFFHLRYGEKAVELSADCPDSRELASILQTLEAQHFNIEHYTLSGGRVSILLRLSHTDYLRRLPQVVAQLHNPNIENR